MLIALNKHTDRELQSGAQQTSANTEREREREDKCELKYTMPDAHTK